MEIFRKLDKDSDSVKNFESHDIKFLTWFPRNPTLEILLNIWNCVGSTYMCGCFVLRIGCITIYNLPVILRCILVWVYFILSEPTHISTPVKTIRHVIAFSHNVSQRRDMDSPLWNFMANLMMHSTCLCVAVLERFYTKNLEKVEKIMNILEFSKKIQHFSALLAVCFHMERL